VNRQIIITVLALVVLCAVGAEAQQVTLHFVDGLNSSGYLTPAQPVTFYVRLNSDRYFNALRLQNGFRLYSDNASFSPPTLQIEGGLDTLFVERMYECPNCDGQGADTLSFLMIAHAFPGLFPFYDDIGYLITTEFPHAAAGDAVCLDSAFIPPAGHWLWGYGDGNEVAPEWDGPHCFTVGYPQPTCHCPNAGNVDGEPGINVSDVTSLVAYLFSGGSAPGSDPACPLPSHGDMNCDLVVNVSDLTYLVAYLFAAGEPPCDPCGMILPESDDIDLAYADWLFDQYLMAIQDTGSSAFYYPDSPGIWEFDSTWAEGDTTVEMYAWGITDLDAKFLTPAWLKDEVPVPTDIVARGKTRDRDPDDVILSGAITRMNGRRVSPQNMTVRGNTVHLAGDTFRFDLHLAVDPPLSEKIKEVLTGVPALSPTALQIWCEGREYVNATRMYWMTVAQTRVWYHQGVRYCRTITMSISVHNTADYLCPDGELLRHEHLVDFSWRRSLTIGSGAPITTSWSAVYYCQRQ